ncbi:MAG: hypothetical protein U0670_17275 [Anaerolineae bacterium]
MAAYNFPRKQRESYALVEKVRAWLARREDVNDATDLQDDPRFFYRGDLVISRRDGTVQYVEVKSEPRYTRDNTPNLAIERHSSLEKNTSGGPWSTSADFYAHVYADGLLVIMSRRKLVQWIESELSRDPDAFEYKRVPNEGWTTGTYLVPRSRAKAALGIFYREYEIA